MFERTLYAGWGDMDSNSHMRNTAFLDKSGDVRMMFFFEQGYTAREWLHLRLGPVIMRDELEYFREINILDEIRVTLQVAGMSDDGSRFQVQNEFFLPNGKLAARVKSTGGWMDLNTRRLIIPSEKLYETMNSLSRTDSFSKLPSSQKN
jgi:acyl-CoA thioester hydrolase